MNLFIKNTTFLSSYPKLLIGQYQNFISKNLKVNKKPTQRNIFIQKS